MGDIDTNSSDSLTETIGGTRVAKREVDTEYVFKIVVLGDYNVGKTTLIHRLLHTSLPSKHAHIHKDKTMKTHNKEKSEVNVTQEESSDESDDEDSMTRKNNDNNDNDIASMDMEHISPTIGVEFFAKFIPYIHPHINVRLQFWDTAGLTRYATLDDHVYRHASLILCVFDVTQKNSLEHIVSQHLVHAAEYIPELEQDKIIVVGNKLDLLQDNVNAFTELLNNYHRHRRPDAAFFTSHISSSFHSNNVTVKNNNIDSMNRNVDIKKPKSNAITRNERTNTDALNDAIANDNNLNNDILYSSSDDNTSTNETTNTNTNTNNNINRITHDGITKQQSRQARLEAEARNSVITEKDVYECLLNDFDDIKYLTVSARSNLNMSRLLELMCDVLLCQVMNAHHERKRDESVYELESYENVSVKEMEYCVNKEQNNTNGNTREEIDRSIASGGNGTYEIKDNKELHIDLQPSSMPLNIPVVVVEECDRTPHYNSYNVGCWSNNDNNNNNNALSFDLSPQEQTATFVESEDNLYSPQEGNDVSMASQHKMQPTQCENNFSSENNNTSMSVTISATQLLESTSQAPENVKIENVLDTHEKMNKEINCNSVKQQIVNTNINQDNNRVSEGKEGEKATCLHQENTINTFTNCTCDNAQVIQKAHLLESHQEPVETNLLEEEQDDEKEIIRPRASLLAQVAHEFEQQRQQANTTISINNDKTNDDGMNLQEELRDRFTAIETESRERREANKTKNCKDNNNNSSTLTHNTINNSNDNSSPVINVAQRYKKNKKYTCQCGSLTCTCM